MVLIDERTWTFANSRIKRRRRYVADFIVVAAVATALASMYPDANVTAID